MINQIHKIYLSNFLTGLVFWYGIEKLFMQSIGLDAVALGWLTVIVIVGNLLLDIPSGILADKWSRKGMLGVSAVMLAACSVLLGVSNGFGIYAVAYVLYSLYVVSTSGTYQAITYDSLHEMGKSNQYSKIMGRAYALFLVGAGVANVSSGFIAGQFGYRVPFFITVLSCAVNVVVIASLREPAFHRPENKEKMLSQIGKASKIALKLPLIRVLAVILTLASLVELFKTDFGQLYMLRYVDNPEAIGVLWALFAFTWAFGGFIAHRLHNRLTELILVSTIPIVIMSFIDNWFALVLFNIQAVASAALANQIETRIQEQTPSHVRASLLSVISSFGRAICIPGSLVMGWLFRTYGAFYALRIVSIVSMIIMAIWLVYIFTKKEPQHAK